MVRGRVWEPSGLPQSQGGPWGHSQAHCPGIGVAAAAGRGGTRSNVVLAQDPHPGTWPVSLTPE